MGDWQVEQGGYRWEISETGATEGVEAGTGTVGTKPADTIISLRGGQFLHIYDTDSNTPHLLPSSAHITDEALQFKIDQQELPPDLAHILEFEEGLGNARLLKQPALTGEQVDRLRMKFYLGDSVDIPDTAAEMDSPEFQEFLEKFLGAEKREVDADKYREYLGDKYNDSFENQLQLYADKNNIEDTATLNEIRMADYGMGGEKYKELANELEAKGIQTVNQHFGISGNAAVLPKSTQAFIEATDMAYTEAYQTELDNFQGADAATKEQMRYLFNNPEASFPNKSQLIAINATLTEKAAKAAGFPGLKLIVDNEAFNGTIHSAYLHEVAQVRAANPHLSQQELSRMAINNLRAHYGLPANFTPPIGPTALSIINPSRSALIDAQILNVDLSEKSLARLRVLSNTISLSDGDRILLKDFIKIISEALAELKEMLFRMQGSDSKKASELGLAKMKDQLAMIELQKKEMEEMRAEREKAETKNTIMQVLGAIAMAAMAVFFIATGNIVGIIALVLIITSMYIVPAVTGEDKSLFAIIFDGIDKAFPPPGNAIVKTVIVAAVVFLALLAGGGPAVAALLFAQLATEAHVFKAMYMAFGMSEQDALIAEAITILILTIAIGFGKSIIAFFKSLKSGRGAAEVAKLIPKDKASTMSNIFLAVGGVAGGAQMGVGASLSILQGRLALMKGEYESELVKIQAMIDILQKLIDHFLEALSGRADFIEMVGDVQSNLWEGLHEVVEGGSSAILHG